MGLEEEINDATEGIKARPSKRLQTLTSYRLKLIFMHSSLIVHFNMVFKHFKEACLLRSNLWQSASQADGLFFEIIQLSPN